MSTDERLGLVRAAYKRAGSLLKWPLDDDDLREAIYATKRGKIRVSYETGAIPTEDEAEVAQYIYIIAQRILKRYGAELEGVDYTYAEVR